MLERKEHFSITSLHFDRKCRAWGQEMYKCRTFVVGSWVVTFTQGFWFCYLSIQKICNSPVISHVWLHRITVEHLHHDNQVMSSNPVRGVTWLKKEIFWKGLYSHSNCQKPTYIWISGFKNLGVKTVLSPATNLILKNGLFSTARENKIGYKMFDFGKPIDPRKNYSTLCSTFLMALVDYFFFKRIDRKEYGVIHLPASLWTLRASFPSFLRNKGTVWCWLSTGLVYTIIHLSVGEKWWIFTCHFAARQISTTGE